MPYGEVVHYRDAKWEGVPKRSRALCPKCNSPNTIVLRGYPVDYTEFYNDYECKNCRHKFTINWS